MTIPTQKVLHEIPRPDLRPMISMLRWFLVHLIELRSPGFPQSARQLAPWPLITTTAKNLELYEREAKRRKLKLRPHKTSEKILKKLKGRRKGKRLVF
jgi:hypothetical protein